MTDNNNASSETTKPEIMAPAGNKDVFYAALEAGADSIYCGLKSFSARMEAENFTLEELGKLSQLAKGQNCRLYIALNTMITTAEITSVGKLLKELKDIVDPEALIVHDLAVINLARQCGFQKDLHLSTLTNVSLKNALPFIAKNYPIKRIVLPRELSLDEIKTLAASCPAEMELETFVHGALCYSISGRCYWSSWLGGKSGLRGRCVQPCRRFYTVQGKSKRFFSCLDLGLDVLSKTLLSIPQVRAWKIEGRKKGAHYVMSTIRAYRLIRDNPENAQAKKTASELLSRCLGRKTTNFFFLSQNPKNPVQPDEDTGSGLPAGKVSKNSKGHPFIRTHEDILIKDLLRVGYQDLPGHLVFKSPTFYPRGSKIYFNPKGKKHIKKGLPVFLLDRKDPQLEQYLKSYRKKFDSLNQQHQRKTNFQPQLPQTKASSFKSQFMDVWSEPPTGKTRYTYALWFKPQMLKRVNKHILSKIWLWLPPVIWPSEEEKWQRWISFALKDGASRFVINSPWQKALFPEKNGLKIWAGPFCNLANPLALSELFESGFSGAFISPELSRNSLLEMPKSSPLPTGIVIKGFWPLCLSRINSPAIKEKSIIQSPKKEISWMIKYHQTIYHYSNQELDLSGFSNELEDAGYTFLARLHQTRPANIPKPKTFSTFNWHNQLL